MSVCDENEKKTILQESCVNESKSNDITTIANECIHNDGGGDEGMQQHNPPEATGDDQSSSTQSNTSEDNEFKSFHEIEEYSTSSSFAPANNPPEATGDDQSDKAQDTDNGLIHAYVDSYIMDQHNMNHKQYEPHLPNKSDNYSKEEIDDSGRTVILKDRSKFNIAMSELEEYSTSSSCAHANKPLEVTDYDQSTSTPSYTSGDNDSQRFDDDNNDDQYPFTFTHSDTPPTKSTWKHPSQVAVSMSLRAETETTGSKRYLASDIYKVMLTDNEQAGFRKRRYSDSFNLIDGPKWLSGPNPQKDHTLINCFTTEQIETHIASLNNGLHLPPQKLKSKCLELLKVLQAHPYGYVFNNPLDPVELGLPDYFEVIKHPMDLGTIKKRLENGYYHAFKDFESDVRLTFDNAMLYNQERSIVHKMAKEMKEKFISDYEKVIEQLNAEENQGRKNGDECTLNNNAMFQNQFNEMNVQQQNRGMKRKKDSDGDDKDDEENDFVFDGGWHSNDDIPDLFSS